MKRSPSPWPASQREHGKTIFRLSLILIRRLLTMGSVFSFYVGLGDPTGPRKAFYRFTADKGWTTLNPFPGRDRTSAVAFVLNGKAYVGMGLYIRSRYLLRDFWCYDPASDSWDSLRMDFPVAGRIGAVGFAGNRYAYVRTGSDRERTYADFYRFSPEEG